MPSTGMDDNPWVRRYHPADRNLRLICFPHAGGSASGYFAMSRSLSATMDVLALQYPGRQDRRKEPCLTSVPELAAGIRDALAGHLDEPFAFFGHSMGAVLAFEVTRLLAEADGPLPVALFASGRRAPSRHRNDGVYLRDDDGLIKEIALLNGSDPRVLQDDEILRMFLPALRCDYEAIETYPATDATVPVPVVALIGDADPRVTVEEAAAWERHTTVAFEHRVFPGGHFFLEPNRTEVEHVITKVLEPHL